MRLRAILVAAMILATGCSDREDTPPSAYRHSRDRIIAALGGRVFGQQPCFRTINGQPGVLSTELCYRMDPPRRMRGIWAKDFEQSHFYPDLRAAPDEVPGQSQIWLDPDGGGLPVEEQQQLEASCNGCFVYLDFVGRRTSVEGVYGHMGSARHYVIVDRLIEAKVLREE
jgi:hypothetical protein